MFRELKSQGKARFKKYYFLFVLLCCIMGILRIEYSSSIQSLKSAVSGVNTYSGRSNEQKSEIISRIIFDEEAAAQEEVEVFVEDIESTHQQIGVVAIDHTRGVLAGLTNNYASGEYLITIYDSIYSLTNAKNTTLFIMIVLNILLVLLVTIFLDGIIKISFSRVFLEARIYDKVPTTKYLHLIRTKTWLKASLALFRMSVYKTLWTLTIIGGFIKSFSYMMVPYILAENPTISGKDAILLSRKMMDGHKMEAFKLMLSFIGWMILDMVTFGLVGIFFLNPYKEATLAQYYFHIRTLAKENQIPGVEVLNDKYLFEYATPEELSKAYADAKELKEVPVIKKTGIRGILGNIFGVSLVYDKTEAEYDAAKLNNANVKAYSYVLENKMYPARLFTVKGDNKIKGAGRLYFDRHYSIVNLLLIFFVMSIVGWLYEVSLHLISDGVFVNRGTLHGPWLPIYGNGSVLILIILNKLRKYPIVEFIFAVVLCGMVEYFTAWHLEMTHGGTKWWDYSGYFININGRVCAEGLLVFGLGGMVIVYLLAPALDNLFRKISWKKLLPIVLILLCIYYADKAYSKTHPNEGEGITSIVNKDISCLVNNSLTKTLTKR